MNIYQHILLTTDLYPEGEAVGQKALELATCLGARLSVVHVLEHPYVYATYFSPFADVEQEVREQAKKHLAALGQKLDVPESDQHLMQGSPKHEVVKLADEIKADLIIVGSHGYGGIKQLLGSTASSIVNSAKVDVLTVR